MHINKNRENYSFKNKRKNAVGSSVNKESMRATKKIKINDKSDSQNLYSNVNEAML